MRPIFMKLVIGAMMLLMLIADAHAGLTENVSTQAQLFNNTNSISIQNIVPNSVALAYSGNVSLLFHNLLITNVTITNKTKVIVLGDGNTVITAPANNYPSHKTVNVTNGQGPTSVNNVTINAPQAALITHTFLPSNSPETFSFNNIKNVSVIENTSPYLKINKKVNLTYGGNYINQTYNITASCPQAFQANQHIVYQPSFTNSMTYNIPQANFSIFVNKTKPLNLSITVPTTPSSYVNVSGKQEPLAYLNNVYGIKVFYQNYFVNRTLLPGQSYTNNVIGITLSSLNQTALAFNWNAEIQYYEKNIVPSCSKNWTIEVGNVTYCVRNATQDIRPLCTVQELIDHNLTEILPECVIHFVQRVNQSNTNLAKQNTNLSTQIITLKGQVKYYQDGGGLAEIVIFAIASIVIVVFIAFIVISRRGPPGITE